MVLIEISLVQMALGAIALLSLAAVTVIAWLFVKFKQEIKEIIKALIGSTMDRDDLEEYVQRRFVLLLKDDELFRKHVEERIMR